MAEDTQADRVDDDEPELSTLRRVFRDWLKPILLACIVVFPFRSAVADYNAVPSGSMKPTIVEGDRIFVNRLAYGLKVPFTELHVARWATPERGEVVVCNSPADGVRLVKRVIAVGGDVLELRDNHLLINGVRARYEWLPDASHAGLPDRAPQAMVRELLGSSSRRLLWTPGRYADKSFGPVTVPAGRVLVMGDNRDNSGDSRVFGCVPEDAVLGRVTGVFYSFDPRHTFKPRWDRFFSELE